MAQRSTIIHIITKVGIFFAALFLVSVLLAAMPAHKQPSAEVNQSQDSAAPQTAADNNSSSPR